MAEKHRARAVARAHPAESAKLVRALGSCATEADIVQVLYAGLSNLFGYDVIDLQVLEHDGWARRVVVDHGVLQESRRFPVSESYFAAHYRQGTPAAGHPLNARLEHGRGPGTPKRIRTYIWMPIRYRRRLIGAVVYEMTALREASAEELAFLDALHAHLGAVVNRASLHELTRRPEREALVRVLATCATEADVIQVLYAHLRPLFAYDAVTLQVLEREGWYHRLIVDQGVLQDVRRLPLGDSQFAAHFEEGVPVVGRSDPTTIRPGRGSGARLKPRTYVWLPVRHHGQLIGAVVYQANVARDVPAKELAFLEEVHAHLGAVVTSAYLHELTRNQALSLSVLNEIGRALASTQDEKGVLVALAAALGPHIRADLVELIVPERSENHARVLAVGPQRAPTTTVAKLRSASMARVREALASGRPLLEHEVAAGAGYRTGVWLPVGRDTSVEAVLAVRSRQPDAYEDSTLTFLSQVADQVALALHNAWSYAALDAQRRRLEVVEAVGRRLASCLDRWSIMRALRAELARHLEFDLFSLAIIDETDEGPIAEGYVNDSGEEQPLVTVPISAAGPSRQAYETGRPVVIQRSPWAREMRGRQQVDGDLMEMDGALLQVTPGTRRRRQASASMVWVPVPHGGTVRALLSVQSYRPDAFSEWHVSVLQDIAAHVSLALGTADQVARLRAILEYSPLGVMLEDRGGRVLFANPEIERLYGVPSDQLLGHPADRLPRLAGAELVPDPGLDLDAPQQYRVRARGTIVEVRRVQIPGSMDHPAGSLSMHEDITRERVLQDARDLMLRAIGHEVRSPAAAMRSTLATLVQWRQGLRPERREALIDEAYEQSERLLQLAEAQLIIGKLETGDFEPNAVGVSVSDVVEQAVTSLHSRYGERADRIQADIGDPRLPDACCEPAHLEQVLANLIGNALEHTDATKVVVRVKLDGDWLRVGVSDDGAGLPADRRERLFERGGLAGGHRAHGGLGLGLYLCRLIVERSFGGRIWVQSSGPRGTLIEFTVPSAA